MIMTMWTEKELNLKFQKFDQTQTKLLPGDSSVEVSDVIKFLVLQYFSDDVCGRHSLGSLGCLEFTQFLAQGVSVFNSCGYVWDVVVADEINVVFCQEFWC